jgi:AcrR family transcriptional regulator
MGRRQGPSEERKDAILDAAEALFIAQGYEGASIREIARRAEVSSALLYWFFRKGKVDLFAAVLMRRAEEQRALTFPPELLEAPPDEVLPLLARGFTSVITQPDQVGLMRLLFGENLRHPELISEARVIIMDRALQPLEGYFARQMALGRIRRLPVAYVTQAFIGLFLGLALRRELLQEPESRAWPVGDYADAAIEIFLQGLALPPGAAPEPAPLTEPAPLPEPTRSRPRRATRIALDEGDEE